MPKRMLIVLHENESRGEQLRLAYSQFIEMVKSIDGRQDATILVPKKDEFQHFQEVKDIFEFHAVVDLTSGRKATLAKVPTVLQSWKTYDPNRSDGPVFAIYPDATTLERIEENCVLQGIIVAEWTLDSVQRWRSIYDPDGPDKGHNNPIKVTLPPPVRQELERLTRIAWDMGYQGMFSHALDERKVDIAIGRIKSMQPGTDPDDIEVWCRRNGWKSDDAKKVAAKLRRQ